MIDIRPQIAEALCAGRPVVALESALISHGLPWPSNLETARAAETAIKNEGCVPGTIAIVQGIPTIGLSDPEIEILAQHKNVCKASRRDLAIALFHKRTAGTTVAATMTLANQAGIALMATGGIGGAHLGAENLWDISADLKELAETPLCVVCSGAKSILDISRTLQILESFEVPVIGYQTNDFPAFYLRSSSQSVCGRADSPEEAASLFMANRMLGRGALILAQPVAQELALKEAELNRGLEDAQNRAQENGIKGPALTPFLLSCLAKTSEGKTIQANQSLVIANAGLAARVAKALVELIQR